MAVPEITVKEFAARRAKGDAPFLLDVRHPRETQVADIGSNQLIPVQELPHRIGEVQATLDQEVVIYCRSGGRSAMAVQMLTAAGFQRVYNLRGGILAWSREVDNSVPTY